MRHLRSGAIGLVLAAIASSGCASTRSGGAKASETTPFCAAAKTLNETPDGDFATMTPDQVRAATQKHFADRLLALTEYERLVPKENADAAAVFVRVARHIAETGDLSEFDTPANLGPIKADEGFLQRECGIAPPG